ncbi:hypothetical protein CsSME_00002322 [Camellia sinensis var. sinensis]
MFLCLFLHDLLLWVPRKTQVFPTLLLNEAIGTTPRQGGVGPRQRPGWYPGCFHETGAVFKLPACFALLLTWICIMRRGRPPIGRDRPEDRMDKLERLVEGLARELRQTRQQFASATSTQAEQTNDRNVVPPPPPPVPQVPP